MRTNFIEVFIGAIVLIVAGCFFTYAYQANKSDASYVLHLNALFDRVDGILEGSVVKMRGVKVGEVTSLGFSGEHMLAKLTFGFSKNIKIPVDSVAEIASDGIMGGKYVAILPGESDSFLNDNDEIKYTQSSISLESLLAKFVFSASQSGK